MLYLKRILFGFSLFIFSYFVFQNKIAAQSPSSLSRHLSPKIVESPDPGQLTVWKDHLAVGFTPTKGTIKNYLKDFIEARTKAFLPFSPFKVKISNYELIPRGKNAVLKIRGVYTFTNETLNFAEIQYFDQKEYRQYSYSINVTEPFDESKVFDFIEKTAARP